MGKPSGFEPLLCELRTTLTQGSKTFQYLEEKKTTVIALVAASENAEAQTTLLSLVLHGSRDSRVGL